MAAVPVAGDADNINKQARKMRAYQLDKHKTTLSLSPNWLKSPEAERANQGPTGSTTIDVRNKQGANGLLSSAPVGGVCAA